MALARSPLARKSALARQSALARKVAPSVGASALRQAPLARKVGLARSTTPARTKRRRASASADRARWAQGAKTICARCGARRGLEQHHVVYAQHVRRAGGDAFDPANSLTLCRACHANHHAGAHRLAHECLSEANLAFAEKLLGAERMRDYLARRYTDARAS